MKSYVLHGDNHVQSRKILNEIIDDARRKGVEISKLEWKTGSEKEFSSLSVSQGLFSTDHLVVVENFFRGNKKANDILEKVNKNTSYVFWEDSTLSPSVLKKLPRDFIVQDFKLPVSMFKFLEAFYPGNSKTALRLLCDSAKNEGGEILLYLLGKQIRSLIWVKEDEGSFKGPDWQKKKLMSLTNKFTLKQLYEIHTKLFEIDRRNKTSQLPETLIGSLEILTLSI